MKYLSSMRHMRRLARKMRFRCLEAVYRMIAGCCRQDRVLFLIQSTSGAYGNLDCVYEAMPNKSVCVRMQDGEFSLKALHHLARARVVIGDQASEMLSHIQLVPKTAFLQVWHSSGLYKKVGFDALRHGYDVQLEIRRVQRIHGQIDWFVISDPKLTPAYAKAFKISEDHVLPFGLPRTDKLFACDRDTARSKFTPCVRVVVAERKK